MMWWGTKACPQRLWWQTKSLSNGHTFWKPEKTSISVLYNCWENAQSIIEPRELYHSICLWKEPAKKNYDTAKELIEDTGSVA